MWNVNKVLAWGNLIAHINAHIESERKGYFTHKTKALQALSLVEKAKLVQVRFTLHLRGRWSKWMQDGCKVYMISYMTPNGPYYMVTRTSFQNNHLFEVGLTQNRETTTLWNLTTFDLLFIIVCEDRTWIEIHWNSIWSRARSHMASPNSWGPVTRRDGLWMCLGMAFGVVPGKFLDIVDRDASDSKSNQLHVDIF